jgi:DNA polymerase-4
MDAFYASVEALDDPGLAGRPVIVGGTARRGVVASCSYEARAFGVRSAMPTGQARRLCPDAVFIPGRYSRYAEVSGRMHEVFQRFTPLVEAISLDEAYLDVSGAVRLFGPPGEIGAAIRRAVRDELGLDCSVGASAVKFVAKLASEAAKPAAAPTGRVEGRGVVVIEPGTELEFLHPLPLEALWGVGPASARRLHRLGLSSVGDLARVPPATLVSALGRAAGEHLARLARGEDDRRVVADREPKSISHEETYAHDRFDREGLGTEALRMADSVASRLRRAGLAGRTVTLKVRYADFTTITRSSTGLSPTDQAADIALIARGLLAGVDLGPGVRLLGVGVSNLAPRAEGRPPEQLSLLAPGAAAPAGPGDGGRAPDRLGVIDAIRARFGPDALGPAALVEPGRGLRLKSPGDTQWGPRGDGAGGRRA